MICQVAGALAAQQRRVLHTQPSKTTQLALKRPLTNRPNRLQKCKCLFTSLVCIVQVAEQQGSYLAAVLNKLALSDDLSSNALAAHAPFVYRHILSMASIGNRDAVLEVGSSHSRFAELHGIGAWFTWRSAYLTRLGSWKKRIETAVNWSLTLLFGRDTSRW